MGSTYGTLYDYLTDEPLRAATREEWEMSAKALDAGYPDGMWRDDNTHRVAVYVDGGPDPVVGDSAIGDFGNDAAATGDLRMHAICERALDGDADARAECVDLIRDYRCREAEALA